MAKLKHRHRPQAAKAPARTATSTKRAKHPDRSKPASKTLALQTRKAAPVATKTVAAKPGKPTKIKSAPKAAKPTKAAMHVAKPAAKAPTARSAAIPAKSKALAAEKSVARARTNNSITGKTLIHPAPIAAPGTHTGMPNSKTIGKVTGKVMGKKPSTGSFPTELPHNYRPSEKEAFMGALQRLYFRRKLLQWKDDIITQNRETLHVLHEDTLQHADLADRATSETDRALELRSRDRQRKLVSKIDSAIARIDDGSYGYCEVSGEPIALKRLDARPIATMTLEAQERHERREKIYRDD